MIRLFLLMLFFALPAHALELSTDNIRQGSLVFGSVQPGSLVFVNKQPVMVQPDGRIVFGVGRDAPKQVTLRVKKPNGTTQNHTLEVAQREYEIQRIDGLPEDKVVTPKSEEVLARIRAEVKEIKAARANSVDEPLFDSGFIWPAEGVITGVYGSQRVLNGTPKRPHFGIDIAAPTGTPVIAPADGIVRMVQDDNYYSGGTLILDHGYGINSAFLHMQRVDVKPGERVSQSQVIGQVGSTGRSTGAHLDWRINWGGVRLDPALVLPPKPDIAHR